MFWINESKILKSQSFNSKQFSSNNMKTYKLKQLPEDFIVKENSHKTLLDNGEYLIFRMKKENYNTETAVQRIADALRINRKSIGYAGAKDSKAHTWQDISIKGTQKERVFELKLKFAVLECLIFSLKLFFEVEKNLSYLIYQEQKDAKIAEAMLKFFDWSFKHGTDIAKQLQYVPMPENVIAQVETAWKTVTANGQPVWK